MNNSSGRYRWLVLGIFLLSSTVNYLDRQTLAQLAPTVRSEFHLTREQYGWILGTFSLMYAAAAPFAGMFVDRFGLNRAASLAIGLWSCAGIATGFTRGLGSLMACRSVLGIAEAAGIPAAGKAIHLYLRPPERALGNALNQAGVSLGAVLAPPVAAWIALHYGWRHAFVFTGALGLLWIPLWNRTASLTRPAAAPAEGAGDAKESLVDSFSRPAAILRDRRLWAFVLANALSMVGYSLWTNWTTQYLVDQHRLTSAEAAHYAWIPPLIALGGGFAGGWLSLRFMRTGLSAPAARFRVCLMSAVLSLITAAIPAAPGPAWACAGISISFFAVSAFSVNTYTLPLDAFGRGPNSPAAFAISMLVASYGATQMIISPAFGALIDRHGYMPVTTITALTPLAACLVLWRMRSVE